MRKYTLIGAVFLTASLLIFNNAFTFQSGGFGDSTGAPFKKGAFSPWASCAASGCHIGNELNNTQGNVQVITDIPNGTWEAGKTYDITFKVSFPGKDVFGFKAMVLGINDTASIGKLEKVENDSTTQIQTAPIRVNNVPVDTNFYITHAPGQAMPSAIVAKVPGSKEWKAKWTAPDEQYQGVIIYATFLAANGNGKTTGDYVYRTSLNLTGVSSIHNQDEIAFEVYPSFAQNSIAITGDFSGNQTYSIIDAQGAIVVKSNFFANGAFRESIDVGSLPKGVYFLSVAQGTKSGIKRFIKQ